MGLLDKLAYGIGSLALGLFFLVITFVVFFGGIQFMANIFYKIKELFKKK